MKCPVCVTTDLAMADRLGVEVDYCPKCRGVWLDRGELDKIIERSLQELPKADAVAARPYPPEHDRDYRDRDHERRDHDDDDHYTGSHGPRRKSFLKDLFDF